jgi:hypothetical protein
MFGMKWSRLGEAIGIYQRAVELGEPHALRWMAWLLERADRTDEAAQPRPVRARTRRSHSQRVALDLW